MENPLNMDRLSYGKPSIADVQGDDLSHTVKLTISQGLNDGGVLCFRLPSDPERFTDLNGTLLQLEMSLVNTDGSIIRDKDEVFQVPTRKKNKDGEEVQTMVQIERKQDLVCLDAGGMHSLFKSCDVYFNDTHVSNMSMYPYTSALSRYLGSTEGNRAQWSHFDETFDYQIGDPSLTLLDNPVWLPPKRTAQRERIVLTGRIFADVLTSTRQFLPPGVSLGIDLRRAPDAFSLISTDNTKSYRAHINWASLYVKRIKIETPLLPALRDSFQNGCHLTYNRLESYAMSIPRGSKVFRWVNCLNNAPLPNRLYLAFVTQSCLRGTQTEASTYFVNLKLESLNWQLNGKDLFVEPMRLKIEKSLTGTVTQKSDLRQSYLALLDVFNEIEDQLSPNRLSYELFVRGVTVFVAELSKCGEKRGSIGPLDLEVFLI